MHRQFLLLRNIRTSWANSSAVRPVALAARRVHSVGRQLLIVNRRSFFKAARNVSKRIKSSSNLNLSLLARVQDKDSNKGEESTNLAVKVFENVVSLNNNNNAFLSTIPTVCVASALVTTAGGYSMSPEMVTALSNFPLVAFAFMQASGIAPIREVVKTQSTGDLNPLSFVMLYVNCFAWCEYGYLIGDFPIMLSNTAGILFGLSYTAIFAKYTKNTNMVPYYLGSAGAVGAVCSSPLWMSSLDAAANFLGTFGMGTAIVLMSSPLAALKTVLEKKNTDAMPFLVSFAMTLNGFGWTQYGILIKNDFFVYFPNGLGFVAGLVQLGFHAKYNPKSPLAPKQIK